VAVWRSPQIKFSDHKKIAGRAAAQAKPSWAFQNPEVDQLISDLRQQKDTLAEKEHILNDLATRLKAEREEIGIVTQKVARLQTEFDRNVVRVREEETANLKRLAKIYGAMTPEGAVSILKEMNDDDVVRILVFMKDPETAPILELLAKPGVSDAKRAALISGRLKSAVYRNPTPKAS
jgi:flagellar motility protein MotE (MotC chaperone)